MGIFDKLFKKKENTENQIENRALKENLANAALGLLVQGVFYFAAQEEKLMRVEINEAMFKTTTETFLEMHQ